jgi:hypothetical protein
MARSLTAWGLIAAAVAAAGLALPAPALAAKVPSFVKSGRAYGPVRVKLLAKSWVPADNQREEGACWEKDDRCALLEARSCSGTGLGLCLMAWRHRDGTILTLSTAGETEAELVIYKVHKK